MSTFSMKLKDELCSLEMTESEEKALLMGLLQVNASINFSQSGLYIDFKSKNESVSLKVYDLIKKFYKLEPMFLKTNEQKLNKDEVFYTRLEQNAYNVLNDLNVIRAKEDSTYNLKKEIQSEEEKLSYIRGAFLACGSVNDPKSNTYHLEIQTFSQNVGYNLRDLMNAYSLNAKLTENRRGYIVYIKSADKIADFLRILGSKDGLFYFEDYRIEKDLSNSINRVMNCEIANERKSQEAAKRQLEEIREVKKYYGDRLKDSLREIMILRENHPEDGLMDLIEYAPEEIGRNVTKSILNHKFREIHRLFEELIQRRKEEDAKK